MANVILVVAVLLAAALIAREVTWRREAGRLRNELQTARARMSEQDQLANVGQFVSGLAQELKAGMPPSEIMEVAVDSLSLQGA